jgi:hypothetical protein
LKNGCFLAKTEHLHKNKTLILNQNTISRARRLQEGNLILLDQNNLILEEQLAICGFFNTQTTTKLLKETVS